MSNYFLCNRCHHMKEIGGGDGVATLRCVCGETEPKVMVDHHGIDGVRYEDPRDVCPWFLASGTGGDDDVLGERSRPVSGCRVWRVESVEATCPYCGMWDEVDPDRLGDHELWHLAPFRHECERCHKSFWICVDDDDR